MCRVIMSTITTYIYFVHIFCTYMYIYLVHRVAYCLGACCLFKFTLQIIHTEKMLVSQGVQNQRFCSLWQIIQAREKNMHMLTGLGKPWETWAGKSREAKTLHKCFSFVLHVHGFVLCLPFHTSSF